MPKNELQHYGIKGMKWGIRRFQRKDGSLTPKGRTRKKQNRKGISQMSNEELQKANQRMQLEVTYKSLKAQNSTNVGRKLVNKIGSRVANRVMDKALDSAINKGLDYVTKRRRR